MALRWEKAQLTFAEVYMHHTVIKNIKVSMILFKNVRQQDMTTNN